MKRKLLVVDDDAGARESLYEVFRGRYDVLLAENALSALTILKREAVDLVIADLVMPKLSGSKLLTEIKFINQDLPIIALTGSSDSKLASDALSAGAVGLIRKPFDIHEIRMVVEQALTASELPREREVLAITTNREFPTLTPVGTSAIFRKTLTAARRAMDSHVLITGEHGTGKEYLARYIHSQSTRASSPLVPVVCCDLPSSFAAGELFGSWSGQTNQAKRGAVDLARGSTLYLDGVDRLPRKVQEDLARLVEKGEFQRTNSTQVVPAKAKLIAATAYPLAEAISKGVLSPRLMDALSLHVISVPSLRERPEDISPLTHCFLNQFRATTGRGAVDITPEAAQLLRSYHWPGNIRELRIVLEGGLLQAGGATVLDVNDLPAKLSGAQVTDDPTIDSMQTAVSVLEKRIIERAFRQSNGSVRDTARILKTTPRRLALRIEKLGIRAPSSLHIDTGE